jgi:outer membrane protein OmpA-like peptidoglycan-associated protein
MNVRLLVALALMCAGPITMSCASSKDAPKGEEEIVEEEDPTPPGYVNVVEYEAKTKELVLANEKVLSLQGNIDEQRRRLQVVCADFPEHIACNEYTAAKFARQTLCSDAELTKHIDEIVKACNQGACKQVDEASLLERTDYMMLVQHLPHKLVTFRSAETVLDANDKKALQQYLEAMEGDKGFIIIVGRASRDGPWEANLRYAIDRAESTRAYIEKDLGVSPQHVGYITYGHDKMYLTDLDIERLAEKKMSPTQANRSALVFTYPCFKR